MNKLENSTLPGLNLDLVTGAKILLHPANYWPAQASEWIVLLDHASDWVRGCAAYRLGSGCDEDTNPTETELFLLIGAKEIERPGIAGCFWSDRSDGSYGEAEALWMLNLLERRKGPVPDQANTPFNDIEFHLHELFATSPDMVDRMMRGGYVALALTTATEMWEPVHGMETVLEKLARISDLTISAAALRHLDKYYSR